ncbi:MAG: metallophosphoesterase [Pseudomonadota bacterium]
MNRAYQEEAWLPGGSASVDPQCATPWAMTGVLRTATHYRGLRWPKREVFFIADPHADAEAFVASLLASGGVRASRKTPGFKLTGRGRKGHFIIGGDCLDKGPHNLELLRAIRALKKSGARLTLIAGNHDLRLLMALRSLDKREVLTEHLFVRMGAKGLPLLREVWDEHLADNPKALRKVPSASVCRARLFPQKDWFERFPRRAGGALSEAGLAKEVAKVRSKLASFETDCHRAGLNMRQLYAAAMKARKLFLKRKGKYGWFFDELKLLHREGSCLFVHAGVDDRILRKLREKGPGYINRQYRKALREDLFAFYHGPLANVLRTKYRAEELPLTDKGARHFYRMGLHFVVHGHRSNTQGQRLMLRGGILHVESDTTLNRNSRAMEGLRGAGAGVTVIQPRGRILGISADYHRIKCFKPAHYLRPGAPRYHGTSAQELSSRVTAGC